MEDNTLGHSSYQLGFEMMNKNDMRNQDEDDDLQKSYDEENEFK